MKRKSLKLITAALAFAGLLAFTGCGEKDPYTVYDEASKKTSALESMELNSDMGMTLSAEGQSIEISSATSAKMSGVNTDNMLADMNITMEAGGQTVTVKSYYKDGYYYSETGGEKIKYAMALEEMQKQLESSALQTQLKKEDFKEISLEKKDDDYALTFTLNGDSMSSLVDSALSSLGNLLSSAGIKMEIGDVPGTATVNKDGYFSSMTMKMPLSMTIQDQEMKMDMNIDATYINPGKEVKVEIPETLDDYTEIDMNALGGQGSTGSTEAEGSTGADGTTGSEGSTGADGTTGSEDITGQDTTDGSFTDNPEDAAGDAQNDTDTTADSAVDDAENSADDDAA